MPINLANLRAEAFRVTGDYLSQQRLSAAAGLARSTVTLAERRGSLSRWSAEKIAQALSVELGRPVAWYEVFGDDYNPVLDDYWKEHRANQRGKDNE
jgi:hypothetical protein